MGFFRLRTTGSLETTLFFPVQKVWLVKKSRTWNRNHLHVQNESRLNDCRSFFKLARVRDIKIKFWVVDTIPW